MSAPTIDAAFKAAVKPRVIDPVAVSRARQDAMLFTDNAAPLVCVSQVPLQRVRG